METIYSGDYPFVRYSKWYQHLWCWASISIGLRGICPTGETDYFLVWAALLRLLHNIYLYAPGLTIESVCTGLNQSVIACYNH